MGKNFSFNTNKARTKKIHFIKYTKLRTQHLKDII